MPEFKVHSFIVKLWLEEPGHQEENVRWHGHITHVLSGDRRYLSELRDIQNFVKMYVADLGPNGSFISRLGRRLQLWIRRGCRGKS